MGKPTRIGEGARVFNRLDLSAALEWPNRGRSKARKEMAHSPGRGGDRARVRRANGKRKPFKGACNSCPTHPLSLNSRQTGNSCRKPRCFADTGCRSVGAHVKVKKFEQRPVSRVRLNVSRLRVFCRPVDAG